MDICSLCDLQEDMRNGGLNGVYDELVNYGLDNLR